MRGILLIAFTAIVFDSHAQGDIQTSIVGDWSAYLTSGDSSSFHFRSDGSMFVVTSQGIMGKDSIQLADGRNVATLMRYVIRENTKPIQIDFYYAMDNYYNVVGKAEGIIELLDNNLLRIAMNYNKPQSIRPKDFYNPGEAGILTRFGVPIKASGCENFRDGKFKIYDTYAGTSVIDRKDDIQIETNELGDKVKIEIEWISDCTYKLTPIEFYRMNKWHADTTGIIQMVEIIKVNKKTCYFSTGNNKTNMRTSRELIKVRN